MIIIKAISHSTYHNLIPNKSSVNYQYGTKLLQPIQSKELLLNQCCPHTVKYENYICVVKQAPKIIDEKSPRAVWIPFLLLLLWPGMPTLKSFKREQHFFKQLLQVLKSHFFGTIMGKKKILLNWIWLTPSTQFKNCWFFCRDTSTRLRSFSI